MPGFMAGSVMDRDGDPEMARARDGTATAMGSNMPTAPAIEIKT